MSNLFVYGTLVPHDFFKQVADRYAFNLWEGETKDAILLNYELRENNDLRCVAPAQDQTVKGVIHTDLDRRHFLGLDQYEGDPWLYCRRTAEVMLLDDTIIRAFVYVGNSILKGSIGTSV